MKLQFRLTCYLLIAICFISLPGTDGVCEAFKIGMILPLSGPVAEYGQSIRRSIELAQEHHGDLLKNITIIYEDAKYDPPLAVSAFQKLVSVDNVDLVYVWGVSFCKAVSPLAETFKRPLIAQCIDDTSARGRNYVVRFMNPASDYVDELIKHINKKGYRKIGILLTENPYLELLYQLFSDRLGKNVEVTLVNRLLPEDMNLKSNLLKLKELHLDAVGVFLSAGQIAQFYKEQKHFGDHIDTFGTNFFESVQEIRLSGNSMGGAVFSHNHTSPWFQDRYLQRFGDETQLSFGALSYDFILLMGKLFGDEKEKLSSLEIMNRVKGSKEIDGEAVGRGVFIQSETRGAYFSFPLALKVINGEQFIELGNQ